MDGWKGTVGDVPPVDEVVEEMKINDMFVYPFSLFFLFLNLKKITRYCGHGSGEQFISSNSLKIVESKSTNPEKESVSPLCCLLFGCSSVKSRILKDAEPTAYAFSYFNRGWYDFT